MLDVTEKFKTNDYLVIIDVEKAFDSLDYSILLRKPIRVIRFSDKYDLRFQDRSFDVELLLQAELLFKLELLKEVELLLEDEVVFDLELLLEVELLLKVELLFDLELLLGVELLPEVKFSLEFELIFHARIIVRTLVTIRT